MTRKPISPATTLEAYKASIRDLHANNPRVKLNLTLTHAKVVQDADATIIGVYRNCFCVEEFSTGTRQCNTFSYADLLTGRVRVEARLQ